METIERICPVCQTTYRADPVRLKHGRQLTCSRECSYKSRADARSNSVVITCATCGKIVTRPSSQVKAKHGASYCSRACHYRGRSEGKTPRIVTAPYHYTTEGKAALSANGTIPHRPRIYHPTTCAQCGIVFDDPNDGRHRKSGKAFCSLECCNAHRIGANNPSWRGGHPGYYGPDWRAARRAARERDGSRCRRCGVESKRALDVHHIRPVSSFADPNEAHSLDNLICLCHKCHMFVEWNGIDFPISRRHSVE